MPKLRNASRSAALAFARKVVERERTGVNVYAAPNEGSRVWYIRRLELPAPPRCECIGQVLLGPGPSNMEESG